jgi:hypothetical protein
MNTMAVGGEQALDLGWKILADCFEPEETGIPYNWGSAPDPGTTGVLRALGIYLALFFYILLYDTKNH